MSYGYVYWARRLRGGKKILKTGYKPIVRNDAYILPRATADNLSAAQADYEAAWALDETIPGGWLGQADVYICQGEYDKAMEVLRGFWRKREMTIV